MLFVRLSRTALTVVAFAVVVGVVFAGCDGSGRKDGNKKSRVGGHMDCSGCSTDTTPLVRPLPLARKKDGPVGVCDCAGQFADKNMQRSCTMSKCSTCVRVASVVAEYGRWVHEAKRDADVRQKPLQFTVRQRLLRVCKSRRVKFLDEKYFAMHNLELMADSDSSEVSSGSDGFPSLPTSGALSAGPNEIICNSLADALSVRVRVGGHSGAKISVPASQWGKLNTADADAVSGAPTLKSYGIDGFQTADTLFCDMCRIHTNKANIETIFSQFLHHTNSHYRDIAEDIFCEEMGCCDSGLLPLPEIKPSWDCRECQENLAQCMQDDDFNEIERRHGAMGDFDSEQAKRCIGTFGMDRLLQFWQEQSGHMRPHLGASTGDEVKIWNDVKTMIKARSVRLLKEALVPQDGVYAQICSEIAGSCAGPPLSKGAEAVLKGIEADPKIRNSCRACTSYLESLFEISECEDEAASEHCSLVKGSKDVLKRAVALSPAPAAPIRQLAADVCRMMVKCGPPEN